MSTPEGQDALLAGHLLAVQAAEATSFHMPAHKGGAGAPPAGVALIGSAAYDADVSEMGGFDYLHDPGAALTSAHERAAALFRAERSWFLVNGATVGNIAAILSVVGDGDEILVARGSHRSVYAGITLAGATPRYLAPIVNRELDGLFGIDVGEVARALSEHPSIRAVHVTNPSYYGFAIDIGAVAALTAAAGVPLIVDEAHGSHWVLDRRFPTPALAAGADLVVHSPHKTLGSLTQSSLLHAQGNRVDRDRIDHNLQMLQSSSPSALLLLSLDFAVDEMARHGAGRWAAAIALADTLRVRIGAMPGLVAYGDEVVGTPGIATFDPTKLVVDVRALGTTGFAAAAWLKANAHLNPEFSDVVRMVFSVTFADDERSIDLLTDGLAALARDGRGDVAPDALISRWPASTPTAVLTPRIGAAAASETVPLEHAAGRTVAEMVIPYPPGIPLLVPGETIDRPAMEAIGQLVAAHARIVGVADPGAATLRCVRA